MAAETKLSVFEAMQYLKLCFDKHAEKEGEKATMTKKELADLLRQQFDIVSKKIHIVVLAELGMCHESCFFSFSPA